MKMFMTLAALAAALATSSLAQANERAGGHWEWQTQGTHGGTKSNLPRRVRVWVKDAGTDVADCNCAMMKASAADCMMDMPNEPAAPSAG